MRGDIIRRHLDDVARDANAVAARYAPDAVVYDPISPQGRRGRDAIRKFHENAVKAFKDVDHRTISITSKGDIVARNGSTPSHTAARSNSRLEPWHPLTASLRCEVPISIGSTVKA